ncbi:MAG: flavocytochrome c, partial [Oscillospiraceae bacterium]
ADTMKGGYDLNNQELVTALAERSAGAIDWLASIGAPLPELTTLGGASNKRAHRPEGGGAVGSYLVEKLGDNLTKAGIEVRLNTKATSVLMKDGAAVGILAESDDAKLTINAKAVVITTGGFGANEALYTSYKPELKGFVTTNAPGATGDGIVMAKEVGAKLVDMEQIQIHPTVHQATSIMITEGLRGDGAILVNQGGLRFFNEMETRDKVSAAEIAQDGSCAYLLFDQALRERVKAVESYAKNKLLLQGDTVAALAAEMKVDAAVLEKTIADWNKAIASGKDEAFGRATGMEYAIEKGPFYAVKVAPGVHHTMGGIAIDTNAEVLSETNAAIPGLFAAGEVTGGIHGGNRLGGNAVADIVIFGRQAGQSAAAYCGK